MVRSWIIAMMAAVTIVVTGCAQGAGNAPSGATERTTPQRGSRGQETTSSSSGNELACQGGMSVSGIVDYAPGAKGEKASPVELARRDFSKKIEAGDKVVAEHGRNAGTVRVVRDGRVVAVIEYRRAGGGWLRDNYRACAEF